MHHFELMYSFRFESGWCLGIIMWRKRSPPLPSLHFTMTLANIENETFTAPLLLHLHITLCLQEAPREINFSTDFLVFLFFIFRTKKKCLPAILADSDDFQLWYYKSLPPSPNRHPITPLNRIRCYISTLHLLSCHIVLSLEWQGLCVCAYVCVRTRGCVGAYLKPCAACPHVNPLMRVPSCYVGTLKLTARWQSEWPRSRSRRGGGLCHLGDRLATLGLSLLWQRGVFRRHLFLKRKGMLGHGRTATGSRAK